MAVLIRFARTLPVKRGEVLRHSTRAEVVSGKLHHQLRNQASPGIEEDILVSAGQSLDDALPP
jgi:hypothetical protein